MKDTTYHHYPLCKSLLVGEYDAPKLAMRGTFWDVDINNKSSNSIVRFRGGRLDWRGCCGLERGISGVIRGGLKGGKELG